MLLDTLRDTPKAALYKGCFFIKKKKNFYDSFFWTGLPGEAEGVDWLARRSWSNAEAKTSDPGGDRTHDRRLKRPLLYQLSYRVIYRLGLKTFRL